MGLSIRKTAVKKRENVTDVHKNMHAESALVFLRSFKTLCGPNRLIMKTYLVSREYLSDAEGKYIVIILKAYP